ncbi:MAG: MnmC family methyltransferase [Cyanobium sp.]
MTWPACAAEAANPSLPEPGSDHPGDGARPAGEDLQIRSGADGSFSLWSAGIGEGFHSGRGALREARETFLQPSQLERFQTSGGVKVVEVCVGTGTNLAVLLESCRALGLTLEWWGLELTPEPLALALSQPSFRAPWQAGTLQTLERLLAHGTWNDSRSRGRMLLGDARHTLGSLMQRRRGQVDLIWHDAFSPQRCPQLWTLEILAALASLLTPDGRWISYCSAAAVREGWRQVGLNLAALCPPLSAAADATRPGIVRGQDRPDKAPEQSSCPAHRGRAWSGGTVASPGPLAAMPRSHPLSLMEQEHLASAAGEPYRDPSGSATPAAIHAARRQAQAAALATGSRGSSSAWRQRWALAGPSI